MRIFFLKFFIIICFLQKIESSQYKINLKNDVIDSFNLVSKKILPSLDPDIKSTFESKMTEILNALGIPFGSKVSEDDLNNYKKQLFESDFDTQIKPVLDSFFKSLKTSNFLKNYLKSHASFNYGKYQNPLTTSLKLLFANEQTEYRQELIKKAEEARLAKLAKEKEEADRIAEKERKDALEKEAKLKAQKEEEARIAEKERKDALEKEARLKAQQEEEEAARIKKEEDARIEAQRAIDIQRQKDAEEKLKRDEDALKAIENKIKELKTETVVDKKEENKLQEDKEKDKEIIKKDEEAIDSIKAKEINVPVQDISPLEKIIEALNSLIDPILKDEKSLDIKNSYMDLLEVLSKVASKNSEDLELIVDQSDVDAYFDKLKGLLESEKKISESGIKSLDLIYAENLGTVLTERSKLRRSLSNDKKLKLSDEKLIKHGPVVPVDIDQEFKEALGALL